MKMCMMKMCIFCLDSYMCIDTNTHMIDTFIHYLYQLLTHFACLSCG